LENPEPPRARKYAKGIVVSIGLWGNRPARGTWFVRRSSHHWGVTLRGSLTDGRIMVSFFFLGVSGDGVARPVDLRVPTRKAQGMATTDVVPHEAHGQLGQKRVVNDMSIQVATVNGSGSQSSNTVLLRSIFQMGVRSRARIFFLPTLRGCRRGTRSAPIMRGISRARKRSIS